MLPLFKIYSPLTIVSYVTIIPKILVCLRSTDEILVIPPFFAAVLILASASKKRTPRYPVAFAVPTLLPTAYPVAFTGKVREQDERSKPNANVSAMNFDFLLNLIII